MTARDTRTRMHDVSEQKYLEFDGHRIAYRVAGDGPFLVVIRKNRRRLDEIQLRRLRTSWRVFQIDPLGYAASDRPAGYPVETLPDQVLALLDHHGVDRFVIWGYSEAGGMSAMVARATHRAAGMIAGGFAMVDPPSEAEVRRQVRNPRGHPGSRRFAHWFWSFDWGSELEAMSCWR